MHHLIVSLLFLFVLCGVIQSEPIKLHPDNPHYSLFRGKPIVLITSAEHYGAVINLDFDYISYLNTLQKDGLNYTRIFVGSYIEKSGAFGIEKNTLAPAMNRVSLPWARSDTPGYANGGNKFNLDRWNPAYFKRLKEFIFEADERDIIVEVTLFSSVYSDENWAINPLNVINNVNGTDAVDRMKLHTLDNGNLLKYQEKLVRKIVAELNNHENFFFEIQNEPYGDVKQVAGVMNEYLGEYEMKQPWMFWKNRIDLATKVSLEWQKVVASYIVDEESNLKNRHLIAQNFCNFRYPLKDIDPNVSLLNFHYASPEAVTLNYGFDRVISFDESGFAGNLDDTYRKQAWRFILAGGGIFNNLDYSFTVDREDGTDTNDAPGGGSPTLRGQLRVLKDFIHSFDFVKMRPNNMVIKRAPGAFVRALAEEGKQYAIYLNGGEQCDLVVELPTGKYQAQWMNTIDGKIEKKEQFAHTGGTRILSSPIYEGDTALRIVSVQE